MAFVDIAVSRPTRAWLLHEYRQHVRFQDDEAVIRFTKESFIGKLLAEFHASVNPSEVLLEVSAGRGARAELERSYVTFEVTHPPRAAFLLSAENEHKIAWLLEQMFKQDFCKYVDMATRFGVKQFAAVRNYLDTVGINEEDYSFDSLVRLYNRHCKRTVSKAA